MPTIGIELGNTWQEVASTPCLLERNTGIIGIYFGTEKPEADLQDYHKITETAPSISYSGTEHTFARNISADNVSKLIVTGSS